MKSPSSKPFHCKKVRARLPEFKAGLLTAGARAAVERHCAACPACSSEASDLGNVILQIRASAQSPVTEAAPAGQRMQPVNVSTILQKADDSARESAPRESFWRKLIRNAPLAAALFFAAVCATVLYYWRSREGALRTELQQLADRVAVLEKKQPEILNSAREMIRPALRDLAGELDARDQEIHDSLEILARQVEEQRSLDAQRELMSQKLSGEIVNTQKNLHWTQNAVLSVAERLWQ